MGPLLGWLGGLAVERSHAHGMVSAAVAACARSEPLVMVIVPEGTRSRVPRWRTGFHHIAVQVGVPIVLAYVDHARRMVGLGPMFHQAAIKQLIWQRSGPFTLYGV